MKTHKIILVFSIFLSVGLFACSNENPVSASESFEDVNWTLINETALNLPAEDLSDEEIASLIFMREEEKLARDVYLTLNAKYNLRVFSNISSSEQKHMDAVKVLLNKYNLEDPVKTDVIGVFENQDLQNLYNQFVERGNISEVEALLVGALIEELDIVDLVQQINEVIDNEDIEYVYGNLKKGSENHLRAFVKNLSVRGVSYSPVYLDFDTYNSIIY